MKNQNLLITLSLALGIAGSAHANTILLTDNFIETPDNEVAANFNNNLASTQGGTLSTVSYNVQGGNFTAQHSNAGYLLFANDDGGIHGYGNVSLNNDFATQANAANQPLKISFNIHSVFGYTDQTTRWVQFNLGTAQNLDLGNAAVGAAVLFRADGGTQALSGGSVIGSASTWAADDLVTITLSGTGGVGSAFNGNGSVATISIGANNLGTFTLAQQTNAYLNFSSYNYGNEYFGGGTFDNLNVALISPGSDYATWGAPYGLSAGSEGGDLDNDGLTNQKEYAFGLIPNSGASVNPITVPFNKNTVTFTYTRRDPVTNPTGLTYTVWTSTNLVDWSPETNLTAVQSPGAPDGNGIQSVGVTLTPAPTAPKFFVQVRAN